MNDAARHVFLGLLALSGAMALAARGQAAPPVEARVSSFLDQLARAGRSTRTLTGRFLQKKRLALFRSEVVTRGLLAFRRPDRLRWESLAPDESLLLVLGDRAELRLPGEAPRVMDLRTDRTIGPLVRQLFVWLGLRDGTDLKERFELALEGQGPPFRLGLVPKDAGLRKQLLRVRVTFGRELLPERIELDQAGGDRTIVELVDLRRNVPVGPERFR